EVPPPDRHDLRLARKPSKLVSPDRTNSRNRIPLRLHDSQMVNRIKYSRIPPSVHVPPITSRRRTNFLTACSALLLFHGMPSWSRNVKSVFRFFSKRLRQVFTISDFTS